MLWSVPLPLSYSPADVVVIPEIFLFSLSLPLISSLSLLLLML